MKYYQVKVVTFVDAENDKLKKVSGMYLVKADSPDEATKKVREDLAGSMYETEIKSVSETKYEAVL